VTLAMTKISSSPRSLYKAVLFGYCGVLLLVIISGLLAGGLNDPGLLLFIFCWVVFGAIAGVLIFVMTRNLANEVFDGGEFLLVRFRNQEDRIPLSNIYDVGGISGRIPRISLMLDSPCRFGAEVSFIPNATWTPQSVMDRIAEDLLVRAEKARSGHAAA
jgi:hypothetical protein